MSSSSSSRANFDGESYGDTLSGLSIQCDEEYNPECSSTTTSAVTARYITNPLAYARYREQMKSVPINYRGSFVDPSAKIIREHLVDKFLGHFTEFGGPNYIGVGSCDQHIFEYATGDCHDELVRSEFLAIDGIELDLQSTSKYAGNSLRFLFPRNIIDISFSAHTPECFMKDEYGKSTVFAEFDEQNSPALVSVEDVAGYLVERNEGSLVDILAAGTHRQIYKVTGFFTMQRRSKSIFMKDIDYHSNKLTKVEINVLTLVGIRVFSNRSGNLQIVNGTFFGATGA